ncbi:MAG: PLDc N-terminal domain-containing protein [Undibacterium sp.]|nr:PLDc N-terminal domain-containing protein [Opitutaceae bacterium]
MFFGGYSIPALIELAAKVACIVHVIRQGRSLAWIWLILLFPVGGPLIYFFVEIWPDLGRGRSGPEFSFRLPQNPTRNIARLTEELEYSSTVEKRVQLARAYAAAERHAEAVETIRACLTGVFKDDPPLTFELAEICFGAGLHRESLDALSVLDWLEFRGAATSASFWRRVATKNSATSRRRGRPTRSHFPRR